ncbi:MAG: ABC transporter permease subunit [Treponema sp.]|jgi:putative aldouronate transport system permease protein|nr:ABC transporter permease subunit [Treponema sp.]
MELNKNALTKRLFQKHEWQLYLLIFPGLIFFIIFHYVPMYGIIIAFKRYSIARGINASPWVGWLYFERFFRSNMFWELIKNTIVLSFYQLIVSFPFPLILALLLNHNRRKKFGQAVQTITYAPHFISLVVLSGMLYLFTSPSSGIVNYVLTKMGESPINFMGKSEWFRHLFVLSHVWQHTGYNAIIFLAALTAIDPSHYEAATLDGASKLQKIWYIDLPAIMPTVITMLLLQVGRMLNMDTQKALLMQTATNLGTSEIIGTYVYKIGLIDAQFSYSTAINLFQTAVNLIILVLVNKVSKALANEGLW